jgi:hypothetical protein
LAGPTTQEDSVNGITATPKTARNRCRTKQSHCAELRQLADAAITIKGGIVMTALLACSVISLALIIERVKCGTAV